MVKISLKRFNSQKNIRCCAIVFGGNTEARPSRRPAATPGPESRLGACPAMAKCGLEPHLALLAASLSPSPGLLRGGLRCQAGGPGPARDSAESRRGGGQPAAARAPRKRKLTFLEKTAAGNTVSAARDSGSQAEFTAQR